MAAAVRPGRTAPNAVTAPRPRTVRRPTPDPVIGRSRSSVVGLGCPLQTTEPTSSSGGHPRSSTHARCHGNCREMIQNSRCERASRGSRSMSRDGGGLHKWPSDGAASGDGRWRCWAGAMGRAGATCHRGVPHGGRQPGPGKPWRWADNHDLRARRLHSLPDTKSRSPERCFIADDEVCGSKYSSCRLWYQLCGQDLPTTLAPSKFAPVPLNRHWTFLTR